MEVLDVVHSSGAYFMTEGSNSYMGGRNTNELHGLQVWLYSNHGITFDYVVNGIFLLRNLEVWGQFVQVRGVRALSVATQI